MLLLVNLGHTLPFRFNEIQFKIYSSVEMQSVKVIFKQKQISTYIISKYRKHTLVLYLLAQIENTFIPIHYEKIIKYVIVHWEYFHSGPYVDLLSSRLVFKNNKTLWPLFMDGVQLPQGLSHFEEAVYFLLSSRIIPKNQICRKSLVGGSNRMRTMQL